jgi:hypothetical protein
MADNYKVSVKQKKVYADIAKLTKEEKEIVQFYIGSGYVLAPKKKGTAKGDSLNLNSIIHFFATKNDVDGMKAFFSKCEDRIVDKNGNERKGGFLVGRKWFKETYKDEDIEIIDGLTAKEEKWVLPYKPTTVR